MFSFLGVNEEVGEDIPFGTFFITGRRFVSFHVRTSSSEMPVSEPASCPSLSVACACVCRSVTAISLAAGCE
jgi:hypothetical protein